MKKSEKILLLFVSAIMMVILIFSRESFADSSSTSEKKEIILPFGNYIGTSTIDLGKCDEKLPSRYITNNVKFITYIIYGITHL